MDIQMSLKEETIMELFDPKVVQRLLNGSKPISYFTDKFRTSLLETTITLMESRMMFTYVKLLMFV